MWVQPFRNASTEFVPPRQAHDARVAVLVNVKAGKVTRRVLRALRHVVPDGDLFLSQSELDARRIAGQVVDRGYPTVFLGGGDGTLTCFLNEIAREVTARRKHHPTAMPRFGVLRLGTGNSVAELIHASPVKGDGIVDDILRARTGEVPGFRDLDLLLVDGKRSPFAGLGLDGLLLNDFLAVRQAFDGSPLSKLMSGPGGYLTSVALKTVPYCLSHDTSVDCVVTNGGRSAAYRLGPDGNPWGDPISPGQELFRGPLMMAAAGTVPFYGYRLRMFPFAGRRKGMMHLRLGNLATTSILANLSGFWRGTWFPAGFEDYLASDVTIRFARPMPLQIAGDAEGLRDELRLQVSEEPIELLDFTGASLH